MGDVALEQDQEIAAIAAVSAALARLTDEEARARVIRYVLARYMPSATTANPFGVVGHGATTTVAAATLPAGTPAVGTAPRTEMPGIAQVNEAGELRLTIRDLKARSGLDAALRLAYVSIYAYRQLTGQALSSAKGLTPILKLWRLYDGNTRTRLARDKGIIRSGDELSLDTHASRDAERLIQEILDPGVEGKWKPK